MNLGLWPEAVPFDPDDGAGSQKLDAYLARTEFPPAALIVAGRGTRASEWAPRTAIGLARALVAAGAEVLLADLEFENPSLHSLLSESSIEGLADVLLFGSSLERVTVLPAGQMFEFVTAGGYAPDPVALLRDPGWSRILDSLAARNTIFLGFAHFDAKGLHSFVERVPDVVLLAAPDEMSRTAAFLPEAIRIAATIRPARAEPVEGAEAAASAVPDEEDTGTVDSAAEPPTTPGDASPTAAVESSVEPQPAAPPAEGGAIVDGDAPDATEPDRPPHAAAEPPTSVRLPDADFERIRLPKDEAREALIADLRARQRSAVARAAVSAPEPAAAEPAGPVGGEPVEPDPTEPLVKPRQDAGPGPRPARPARRGRYAASVLLVLVAVVAVWFFGFRGRGGAGDAPMLAPAIAEPRVPPEPAGEPLAWSVAVEAHNRLSMALRSVDSLAARDSTIGFYVSPAVVSGDLWYRVLAGPLADSLGAVAAMDSLVQRGLKKAFGVWDVRNTPFTFLLGRFRLRTDAVDRMRELTNDGVPTYIVEVPYTRGEPWYHLYSGAYADAPEADRMGQILRDAGLPDSLVVRTGRAAS